MISSIHITKKRMPHSLILQIGGIIFRKINRARMYSMIKQNIASINRASIIIKICLETYFHFCCLRQMNIKSR